MIVHDDGTRSNDDRLGAIGDMLFVIERAELDDDLLVIAGDNLFDFSLAEFVEFWRPKGVASAVAVRDVGSLELASHYGIVALADDGRVVDFEEKPADPPSTLAATATYLFHREHARLISTYLDGEHGADQPGPLRRLAAAARARLRLALRRHLVRHREPRAAARGRQPPARRCRPAGARALLPRVAHGRAASELGAARPWLRAA